jgi:hypothetical protein
MSKGGRPPLILSWNGETLPLQEWVRRSSVSYSKVQGRLRDGWPVGEALGFEPHESRSRTAEERAGKREFLEAGKPIYGLTPEHAALLGLIDADEYLGRYK